MSEWLTLAATIVGALIINGAGIYLAHSQREKNKSDAASTLTGTALTMVQRWERRVLELEAKIDDLEERVEHLENENRSLRDGAERLEVQVVSLGQRPVFRVRELLTAPKGQP